MSRRTFRAEVAAPRPAAAWMLVTVASACLWITQQLGIGVITIQTAAILFSLWRRERPFPWQKSPITLNLGMVGIVAVTIEVALRGVPSTISLAHFAALTQGLQLVDARPRKTEFLLVALALFQVVLASNLTDSVFFPPLLVAFVVSTAWTLLVHTLRTEAIEAGDARGVSRAITPGLLRMALVSSALSVALALVLFVALPRMRSSVLTASRINPTLATAGFSSKVELGDLGRIRMDRTVVMRVETLEGAAPLPGEGYWRGLAFDHFDGTSWSITPKKKQRVPGSAEGGTRLGRESDPVDLVQRIVREPVQAGVIFVVGVPREIQGTVRHLERDTSGGLYSSGQPDERIRYTISSERKVPDPGALALDRVATEPRRNHRNLQLPELTMDVEGLARSIVAGLDTDAERVRALERYLVRNGRYTDDPPDPDPTGARSPIEIFLEGGMAGHCEYFASAMVLLARSIEIPARLVNGFAGGHANSVGGFLEVARADAHTWVEVHYEKAGWVRYDPTPPDLRLRPAAALSFSERMRELGSAVELWWFQSVVGFDRSDQMHAMKRAWLAWRRRGGKPSAPTLPQKRDRWSGFDATGVASWVMAGVVLVATAGLLLQLRRGRNARAGVPPAYREALRLLARRGLAREPQVTARAFARAVAAAQTEAVGHCFSALTEAYLAERFGGRSDGPCREELLRLKAALQD